ncbi:restriction endonuclease [Thauera sinica]|uniref:Restriction endonuclease n=1 Tax=Thauera sinica TaxID=2665146 RepID=A0ABW1AXX9_9RHOO|nr:restriction endonuclease [Thauera sp. K11]
MDVVAMLPWWAGVALAAISYLVLHRMAGQEVVAAVKSGEMGTMVAQTLWKTLATFGQYLLPLICVAGAGISAWRRRERRKLIADVGQSNAADALDGMNWREFEMLVSEAFRLQGYGVLETGGGGADGGVDLVLSKGTEKYLVQCKQWKAFKVGVDVVRELYGVMAAKGAAGGFVVTSGRFTEDAVGFASGRNLKLIDGPLLHGLIRQARSSRGQAPAQQSGASPLSAAQADTPSVPGCPACGTPMVKRTAKRGANAGEEFWGCSAYPACRGTRQIG